MRAESRGRNYPYVTIIDFLHQQGSVFTKICDMFSICELLPFFLIIFPVPYGKEHVWETFVDV